MSTTTCTLIGLAGIHFASMFAFNTAHNHLLLVICGVALLISLKLDRIESLLEAECEEEAEPEEEKAP